MLWVGLATVLRPIALHLLTVGQLREQRFRGIHCIVFHSISGVLEGQRKTECGVNNRANDRARVFLIPDEVLLGGRFNFYGLIKDHLVMRMNIESTTNRFHMGLKVMAET